MADKKAEFEQNLLSNGNFNQEPNAVSPHNRDRLKEDYNEILYL